MKRNYRIDCMARKINSNFLSYLKNNKEKLNINQEFLLCFKKSINCTSRTRYQELNFKYPCFKFYYEEYLKSTTYKKMIKFNKLSYEKIYFQIFYKHSKNFLEFYLQNSLNKKNGLKNKKLKIELA